MGLAHFAKAKVSGKTLGLANFKPCCFLQQCIPKSDDSSKCGAISRAYTGGGKKRKDEQREELRKARTMEGEGKMEKIAMARRAEIVECRAFFIGRCRKANCPAAHVTDPKTINCCSKRFGTASFSKRKDKCPLTVDTCPCTRTTCRRRRWKSSTTRGERRRPGGSPDSRGGTRIKRRVRPNSNRTPPLAFGGTKRKPQPPPVHTIWVCH